MKVWVVKVCTKAGIGRRAGHKKRVFAQIFNNTVLKRKLLTVQVDFCKIIDVVRRELCSVSV